MQKTLSVINLRAIRANAEKIRRGLNGKKFFAVVKADAYGHGAEAVSRSIEDLADGFCVALAEEGAALRIAGISKPILVFTPPLDGYDVARIAHYNLTATVNCLKTAKLLGGLPCHIKVNTGMNRSGCNLDELPAILKALPPESVTGIYSHMYAPENDAACARQLYLFGLAEKLAKSRNDGICAHLSASGGFLRGGAYLKDGVRCGILLYGYAPSGFSRKGYIPAMKIYARKTQITRFIGGGVGYNSADKNYGKIGVYRLGYADGFFRGVPLGEKTLCMDAFLRDEKLGGNDLLCVMDDADAYASRAGTISYEVLTSVTQRSERVYES